MDAQILEMEMTTYSNLNLSHHAICRAQQRGVTIETLKFVMVEADVWLHAREGCYSVRISKNRLGRLSRDGSPASFIEKATNIVLIIDPADFNKIVTVLHDDGETRSRRYRTQWSNGTARYRRRSRMQRNPKHIAFGPYSKVDMSATAH